MILERKLGLLGLSSFFASVAASAYNANEQEQPTLVKKDIQVWPPQLQDRQRSQQELRQPPNCKRQNRVSHFESRDK
jgi:hypothetical protein